MKIKVKKEYAPSIRSRHPSHRIFRGNLETFPVKSVIRLGSVTELDDSVKRIEINTVKAVSNSASKLKMKHCFAKANVKTASWYTYEAKSFIKHDCNKINVAVMTSNLKFPIIAKSLFGSRGRGNTKLDNLQQLEQWLKGKNTDNYIFEEFFDGSREYRFHVSTLGVFLTWRKLRKNDTAKNERWFFNNHNCNWVSESHELYNKPSTYNEICVECLKALEAVGLDIGACDVRCDKKGNFIIIEINSAPSMAEVTAKAYTSEFKKLITNKLNK